MEPLLNRFTMYRWEHLQHVQQIPQVEVPMSPVPNQMSFHVSTHNLAVQDAL